MVKLNVDVDHNPEKIEELIKSMIRAEGVVAYTAPYAIYVEFPTGDYDEPPPFNAILAWVKIKFGLEDEEAKELAGKVQQKIFENGTDGVYFARDTVQEYRSSKAEKILKKYEGSEDVNAPERIVRETLDSALEDSNAKIVDRNAVSTGFLKQSGIVVMGVDADEEEVGTL